MCLCVCVYGDIMGMECVERHSLFLTLKIKPRELVTNTLSSPFAVGCPNNCFHGITSQLGSFQMYIYKEQRFSSHFSDRSGIPSLPGSPRSSLSARRARSLRRANRAQHAEPSGVRGAVARAPPIAAQPEPALQPPAHGRPDHVCQGTRLPHPALGGGAAPARPARALRAGGG